MKNNVEKKLATARNAYIKAAKRLAKLKARYQSIAEKIYLVPGFDNVWRQWCGGDESDGAEPLVRETQFISFAAMHNYMHERQNVWEHAPESEGWEFRPISECKWRVIDRLEIAILNAWEQFNEAQYVFFEMSNALPTLF